MKEIPIKELHPNPDQPRKKFDEATLEDLAESIKEHGLLEPIIAVRRKGAYMIVAGERRFRACQIAGLKKAPVRIIKAGSRKVAELALLENLQREDLNIIEEATAYSKLMAMGMSMEEVAAKMGFRQSWRIQERLNILKLDPVYQDCLVKNILTPSQAQELSRLSRDDQRILFNLIREGKADTYNKLRALANAILFKKEYGEQASFVDQPSETEVKIKKKYDGMVDALLSFISRSFSKEDLTDLQSVVSSSLGQNIQKLDMVIGYLHKIKKAMIQAQSTQEVILK